MNIKVFISILLTSLLLGAIYNAFSSDGIPFIRKELIVKSVSINDNDTSSTDIKGLELDQVINLYNQNVAIFIDARDQWEYSDAHIKGAINIPEFSFTSEDKSLAEIEKETLLVVYCDGDDCDISKRLTNELMKLGYHNSFVFLGGINKWSELDLPLEKGNAHE